MNREEHGVRVIALIHCSNSTKWRFEMVYGAILGNDRLVCAFISPHHCHNSTDIWDIYTLCRPHMLQTVSNRVNIWMTRLKRDNAAVIVFVHIVEKRLILEWPDSCSRRLSTRVLTTFSEVQIFHKNPSLKCCFFVSCEVTASMSRDKPSVKQLKSVIRRVLFVENDHVSSKMSPQLLLAIFTLYFSGS